MRKSQNEFRKDYERLYLLVSDACGGSESAGDRAKIILNNIVFHFIIGGNSPPAEKTLREYWPLTVKAIGGGAFAEIAETLARYDYTTGESGPGGLPEAVGPAAFANAFEGLSGRKSRKSGGVFYTPLPVAQYMCRESLKYFLAPANADNSDSLLAAVKVCDPAAGAGAFLAAMLDEITASRAALTQSNMNKTRSATGAFKLNAIRNCLYGIDIDPAAVEMSKLRLRLSLAASGNNSTSAAGPHDSDLNISHGNALLGAGKITESAITHKYKHFFPVVMEQNGGFDIVIGNPPYGARIDENTALYSTLYPGSTKFYKDSFKIFIELALSRLLKPGGILCFIVPNTLLLQSRYRDARRLLLKHNILEILDFGEAVFDGAVVPTCVVFAQKDGKPGRVKYYDTAGCVKTQKAINPAAATTIRQSYWVESPDNIFACAVSRPAEGALPLGEIMVLKDGGIKYQRVKIGLSKKGGGDLADRLFYEGRRKHPEDIPFFAGRDLARRGWRVDMSQHRFMRRDYGKLLRDNEIVYFNRELFDAPEKLVWRQTSSFFAGARIESRMWFANTIQGGYLKDEYRQAFDIGYVLALLNSDYLRYLYSLSVRETGRVFPQVKLSKLKYLPIKKISRAEQKPFAALVEKIERATDPVAIEKYEKRLNEMVFKTYDLSGEEIEIIGKVSKIE
jgi:hypothetical protein